MKSKRISSSHLFLVYIVILSASQFQIEKDSVYGQEKFEIDLKILGRQVIHYFYRLILLRYCSVKAEDRYRLPMFR